MVLEWLLKVNGHKIELFLKFNDCESYIEPIYKKQNLEF